MIPSSYTSHTWIVYELYQVPYIILTVQNSYFNYQLVVPRSHHKPYMNYTISNIPLLTFGLWWGMMQS